MEINIINDDFKDSYKIRKFGEIWSSLYFKNLLLIYFPYLTLKA